ncbi:MAG: neutral/alkaline non-lysosomal ceramidase N-terminal domain-containing protein [Verrucomicrobiota bacterium]
MKRLLTILALYFGVAISAAAGPLEGGAAIADITPQQWPLKVRGSFTPKLVDSAADPLTSRAMVLSDGSTTISIAVVDNCLIDRVELDKAKEIAKEKSGIPTENMLISSTHTHSAPFSNAAHGTPEELAYQKLMIEGIAQSIIDAHANLAPAQVGWSGVDLADEVFNRRWFLKPGTMPTNPFGEDTDIVKMNPGSGPHLISPAGPIDPEVSVLSLRNAKGQPVGLLGNYSLHYVGATGGLVSADYFGEFNRLMGVRFRRAPETGFVGILSNGTSGDINNINFAGRRPPREPFEQIRIVAGKVADAAYHAYRQANHETDLELGMVERIVTLQLRKPDDDLLARAKEYLATEDESTLPRLAKAYAGRVVALHEGPDTIDAKIQAVKIGDLAICTYPFETFAEIGLEVKVKSPFGDTFVVSLANGAYGYLPTKEQHEFGGYETWMGTCKVQFDANEILTSHLLEMLAELKM